MSVGPWEYMPLDYWRRVHGGTPWCAGVVEQWSDGIDWLVWDHHGEEVASGWVNSIEDGKAVVDWFIARLEDGGAAPGDAREKPEVGPMPSMWSYKNTRRF